MRNPLISGKHAQNGKIEVAFIYWAVVVMIGWQLYSTIGSIWLLVAYAIAVIWFGSSIGALPFADELTRESIVKKAAEKFGGEFNEIKEKVFGGGMATSYSTSWEDESCSFRLYASVGGLTLSASKPGTDFLSTNIKCSNNGLEFNGEDTAVLKTALGEQGEATLTLVNQRYKADPYLFVRDDRAGVILSLNFSVSHAIEIIDLLIPVLKGILMFTETT